MNKTLRTYLLGLAVLISSCLVMKPEDKPTLFLIGDSTVRHGSKGMGDGGRWGWGDLIAAYFDTTKISVKNEALGGTSSRTFMHRGRWAAVLPQIKKGDYVIMQFGHNDRSPLDDAARARGTIQGNGNESKEIYNPITKQKEVVYTYGWYLRKFISDIQAKGATAIVASSIPQNNWSNGKVERNFTNYSQWAHDAAVQGGAYFIDLHKIASDHYDREGEQKVRATYFNATDGTHTIEAGARLNAQSVVEGLNQLKRNPLKKYLKTNTLDPI
ncbi:rhamnogalacturonan acetylesterase [Paradesertivirga mongoliensis]|uniref:Rhamnogalacturonan acetylesterase n=1 Tax=Paradesertivirga mongoliensis TaxID=2100740 RepID=A0ABW4ZJF4_9SPHI|nr:rhamnogalacturonan acetylesterase [Pedobacter mongoliensis]